MYWPGNMPTVVLDGQSKIWICLDLFISSVYSENIYGIAALQASHIEGMVNSKDF